MSEQLTDRLQNSRYLKFVVKIQLNRNRIGKNSKLEYRPNMNVISALMEIRRNPVNAEGKKTTPVNWDMNCLEEVCGACSMVINGRPRQSCTALVDQIDTAN